ncbi:hypothetical protein NBRC116188_17340 [Oceaniserpentilla sp. 4NH20-0058]|uniref:type IV pili methyl-accepting chemotaxis transducer N-terminal domain-containing protein n=1 Tax=Oceaniserpentilla sp. 4NH20-0058 TaxID=3127660 RepID=UPI0031040066
MAKNQKLDAHLINEAGRQRMLSQRAALGVATLLNKIYLKQDIDELTRTYITDSTNLLLTSHKTLIAENTTEEIKTLYFSGDPSLNDEVLAYCAAALSISQANKMSDINPSDLSYFEAENVSYLLFRLNIMVIAYEDDAQSKLQDGIFVGTILWLILLITLISEYNFLLKPTINLIQKSVNKQG